MAESRKRLLGDTVTTQLMWKTYQFKVSVKDDNYDAWKTANIRIMTPVKLQISKFKADKILSSGL
jgi:hypothetical protein